MVLLRTLLSITNLSLPDIAVHGISLDSRRVNKGDLFFAYPGVQVDGRCYIQDAIQRGAVAIVQELDNSLRAIQWQANIPIIQIPNLSQQVSEIASRFYNFPSKKMIVIGVTGTNGKTSCCHLLAEAIGFLSHKPVGVLGTVGNGLFGQLQPANLTTADAITIQKLLHDFAQQGVDIVVMETSSHALEQGRVAAVDFDIGVYTNITHDHLDYHGDIEHYAAAKHLLFEMPCLRHRIFNLDDSFGIQWFREYEGHKKVLGYSCDPSNCDSTHKNFNQDISVLIAKDIKLRADGISSRVIAPQGSGILQSRLLGRFNLSNLLAVVTTLLALEYSFEDILFIVPQLNTVPGRMQTILANNQPTVVIDFAHTPDALEQALTTLREHCLGKLYCVFGCGGDRDRTKRPEMARIAEAFSDQQVITNDNPRTEDPSIIFNDMRKGLKGPDQVHFEEDRTQAIQWALQSATQNDIVLIAGKGHEEYQVIGSKKIPYSDFVVVQHCFDLHG